MGFERLRNLVTSCADAPQALKTAREHSCPACLEANATRHGHPSAKYQRSYPGRLIHADIVGPFHPSHIHGYRYMLVMVDDHSRFKQVYFLRSKDEAMSRARRFVNSLNAYASRGKSEPVRIAGSLKTDNAGEFLTSS